MPSSLTSPGSARLRARRARPAVLVVASALAVSTFFIPTADAAPSDRSEARAALLEADLLSIDLADLITVESGTPSDPAERRATIDAALLDRAVALNLPALSVPLISDGDNEGLLYLGDGAAAGLLKGYAYAPNAATATAASGALTDAGAIDLAAGAGDGGVARLDLTGLTDQLGVDGLTDHLVDRLALELGALASSAHAQTGSAPTSDYLLAGAVLKLHSPAVAALGDELREAGESIETAVNATFGPGGALSQALAALDIAPVNLGLASLDFGSPQVSLTADLSGIFDDLLGSPLVGSNGVVVDLADGTISVDLATLAGGLNDLPANTQLLTTAQIGTILDSVSEVLDDAVTETVSSLVTRLGATQLEVTYTPALSGFLISGALQIKAAGTLAGFAGDGPAPLLTATGEVRVAGAPIALAGLLDLILAPVRATVLPAISPIAAGLLSPDAQLFQPLTTAVVGTLDALSPVLTPLLSRIVEVTVNSQSTASNGAFTVRALQVTLLPEMGAVVLPLAASTVRVAPAVITGIDPDHGPETGGTAITITGVGFTGATGVTIDGKPATDVVVVNDTTVTAVTPPGVVGPREVIVVLPGEDSAPGDFTYEPVVTPSPTATPSASGSPTASASASATPSQTASPTTHPSGSPSPGTGPSSGASGTPTQKPGGGVRPGVPSTGADGAAPVAAIALLAAAVGFALRRSRRIH